MSKSRAREALESLGGCVAYIGFGLITFMLVVMFLKGAAWLASVILPISGWITLLALAFVPVCLIAAIPRTTRSWAGLGIVISSYTIGLCLWLWSLAIAFYLAGAFWLIVGLSLAGIGVVLVAAIAALLQAEWAILIQIIIGVAVVYILRLIGHLLIGKSGELAEQDGPLPPDPPAFY